MQISPETIQWLLAGDPAIRWQVQRDLLDAPQAEWQAEQRRLLTEGWAARMLAQQNEDGGWGRGVYGPKWTSTTYTLLSLREMGLPRDCPQARRGAEIVIDKLLGPTLDAAFLRRLVEFDRCIAGMVLEICIYFGVEDERIDALIANLLGEIMPDGGWNCRRHRKPAPHHSSFHTTLNVLDGLREVIELRPSTPVLAQVIAAEESARELLAQHHLFRSDKTGEVIHKTFDKISYPHRWFYDFLRGLAHFARADAPRDPRLQDGIDLLYQYQDHDGRWHNQVRHSGIVFFPMEGGREASRWNTLRALRVLRWWGQQPAG